MRPDSTRHAHSSSISSLPVQREFQFDPPLPGFSPLEPAPPQEEASAPPPATPPTEAELTRLSRTLLNSIGEEELARDVRVSWNYRLRTTAGRAYRLQSLVELNPALLEVPGDEVDRTLRHELAHLVAYRRAGNRHIEAHGTEWKEACAELGIPGENRCHNLAFPRVQQRRKYGYLCLHCGNEIYRVRKIRRQVACFDCCKSYNQGRFTARFILQERLLHPDENPV